MDVKKKRLIIMGLIILLISGILIIVYNISKSNRIKKENMIIIDNSYQELSLKINNYNEIRKEYLELVNNFFYDTFKDNLSKYNDVLDRYDLIIKGIDNDIDNIDKRCHVIYDDSHINKICNSYQVLYEKLVNLYIMDIDNYNKRVMGYNEYKEEKLEIRKKIYDKYIDYNNDKKYEVVDNNEKN